MKPKLLLDLDKSSKELVIVLWSFLGQSFKYDIMSVENKEETK